MVSRLTLILAFPVWLLSFPRLATSETPSLLARRDQYFVDRTVEIAAIEIGTKTGRKIAVAYELWPTEISLSSDEPATPEQLYQRFVSRMRELGHHVREVGSITAVVPGEAPHPTPETLLSVDFGGIDLSMVAHSIGGMTGKQIVVSPERDLPKVSFSVTQAQPAELYRQFIATIQRADWREVEIDNVVILVPAGKQ